MTTATLDYSNASIEDMNVRGAELRKDLSELSAGERSDEQGTRIRALLGEVEVLDAHLTLAQHQRATEEWRRQQEEGERGTGPLAGTAHIGEGDTRSAGDLFVSDSAIEAWLAGGMRSVQGGGESITVNIPRGLDNWQGVRALTDYGTGGPGNAATNQTTSLLPVGQPIAPTPRQGRLFMRQLIPVMNTTLPVVPYVRELGPVSLEGGASAVAETALKPDAAISFDPQSAYVTVVAANVSPSRQLWEDAPLVVQYINLRLPYLVKVREDAEILNGSGTYPDIRGINNTTGVQTATVVAADKAQTIGLMIAQVENVDLDASAVVMNPTDAWAMFIKRASNGSGGGSGQFDAGSPFMANAFQTVWGLPVKRSRIYAQGSCLVGAFADGAAILDRQQVNVQVYPQHADYAAKNLILVQCEERVGVMWFRPDGFVKASGLT